MYFGMFDPTVILLIPAIAFTLYAQMKVKGAYNRYSGIRCRRGMTGCQVARRILDANGLGHVQVGITPGVMTDHYDPVNDVMNLSPDVYNGTSIAAVSIAAHESGHAIQDSKAYGMLRFRSALAPVTNFASSASWILILAGFVIIATGKITTGNFVFDIGILLFAVVVLFHLVTLPVELNASRRAIEQLTGLGIIDSTEVKGARKVLSAAAMTYIAALATAVLQLIRLLLIRGRD